MKRTILFMLMVCFSLTVINARSAYDNGTVYRTIKPGKYVKVCDVKYYVNGDTLFTNQMFSHLGFIYSDNRIGKMVQIQKSLIFDKNQRKGLWYYVVFSRNSIKCPANSRLSAVVLRDCHYGIDPKSKHRCADAYLYNTASEIPSWKGTSTMTTNIKKLKKFL